MKQLTEIEKAWLAGFIDGEGYIGLLHHPHSGSKNSYQLQLQITTTSKFIIELLADWLQLPINLDNLKTNRNWKAKWKTGYRVRVYDRKCEAILKAIYPYLRLKKSHADIAFEFRKTVDYRANQFTLSQANIAKRAELCSQMKELNRRGNII